MSKRIKLVVYEYFGAFVRDFAWAGGGGGCIPKGHRVMSSPMHFYIKIKFVHSICVFAQVYADRVKDGYIL